MECLYQVDSCTQNYIKDSHRLRGFKRPQKRALSIKHSAILMNKGFAFKTENR